MDSAIYTPAPSDANLELDSIRKSVHRKQRVAEYSGQVFLVFMGRIARNTEAFHCFVSLVLNASVSQLLLDLFIDRLDEYAQMYASTSTNAVPWAECSFKTSLEIMLKPNGLEMPSYLVYQHITNQKGHDAIHVHGQRYKGKGGYIAAVTKIQATWRMYVFRKVHLWVLRAKSIARKLVIYTYKARALLKFHKSRAVSDITQERISGYKEKLKETNMTFQSQWEGYETNERVVIHIASLDFTPEIRSQYSHTQHWQMEQFGRLVDLMNPETKVVFITEQPSPQADAFFTDLLNETFDQKTIKNRLLLLKLKRPAHFDKNVSVAKMLYCNTDALNQISDFVGQTRAYLVPAVAGDDDVEFAHVLQLTRTLIFPSWDL
jgi:hypothetical protein